MEALPSDHATILASKEDEARRDLRRLGWPAHGRATELILCVFLHGGRDEWCPDGTGADGVHADTVGDLLVVETACEGDDGAFAGGVVEEVGTADVGVH